MTEEESCYNCKWFDARFQGGVCHKFGISMTTEKAKTNDLSTYWGCFNKKETEKERIAQKINELIASYCGKDTITSLLVLNEKTYTQFIAECQAIRFMPKFDNDQPEDIREFQSCYQDTPIRILHSPQTKSIIAYREVE